MAQSHKTIYIAFVFEYQKVCLKSTDIDQVSSSSTIFKPTVGFKLRPSLGSAFQPLQPIFMPIAVTATDAIVPDPPSDT